MIRTILVPLTTELSSEPLLDAALLVAKRLNGHIRALSILPNPDTAFAYLPDVILAAGVTREVIARETQEAAAAAKDRFVDWRKHNNVPETPGVRLDSCFASWSEQLGDIETIVARFGRVSDFIVVSRPSSSFVQGQRCFDAAVFESGRPTLVVGEGLPFAITDHVMIAWNASLEASRAILGAMPLLHLAGHVSIFAAPQYENEGVDTTDLVESLSWHGIRAAGPRSSGRELYWSRSSVGRSRATSDNDRNGRLYAQSPATELSRWCDETPPRSCSSPTANEPLNGMKSRC
jgi:hypothetical protein